MSPQRLGQNFLADPAWRERIARTVAGSTEPGRGAGAVWLEIGAGHGEMTSLLARQAQRVAAIELDDRLIPGLRNLAEELGNVTVVAGDVLALNLGAVAHAERFRIYGNIPYYITSPILHRLFDLGDRVEAAWLVMQREVADRLVASPGRRDYGYLSCATQFHFRPQILLHIPPGAFRPAPQVGSALVELRPPGERATLHVGDERAFLRFLMGCFAQKRKTLRNNLRALPTKVPAEQILREAGISPAARAEQLTLTQFAKLFAAAGGPRPGQARGSSATNLSG